MEPTDLTIEILKDIRDETRKTSEGLQQTNEEVRKLGTEIRRTNERLDDMRTELTGRMTAVEMRVATELVAVAGAVREVRDLLREDRALRGRVDDHERRIAVIEGRAGE